MTCTTFKMPDGGVGIICTPRVRVRWCADCGKPASKQCDFPLRGSKAGKTCDRHICERCAVDVGTNLDYCQVHARAERPAQRELFR